ncbi:MAG TPA: four helix bundle protein [Bacteroidia bacterium]|jgi:four helix bundle protein|nr:four helix bundle protein [Bacteroidia bacterium]
MKPYQDLKTRTKKFAANVWRMCNDLPNTNAYWAYNNQLIRASSSVGANYRAALRGKSNADFINKLKIVEEETDECCFFMELLLEINPTLEKTITPLLKESGELLAITVTSIKTARSKN